MAVTYTAAAINRFGGPDDWVSGAEASGGFTVTGTANYDGTAPVNGSSVSLEFSFSDGTSQAVTATISAIDAVNQTISFTVADPSLTLPGGAGNYTARISNVAGSGIPSPASPTKAFAYITCFVRGTRLATSNGLTPVEELLCGDLVITAANGPAPVKWIGRRRLNLAHYARKETAAPVRIRRDAFASNVPSADLLISPDHAVLVDERLVCARQLVNGASIDYDLSFAEVEYFHVELQNHDVLLAEGLTVESYLNTGNRGFFSNADEPLVLRPDPSDEADLPAREAASCIPFASSAETVRPIWERLAARAAMLGAPATAAETTNDPEMRIEARGRTLLPIHAAEGLHIFVLPKGVTEVRIQSRTSVPSDIQPWLDDRRSLGVSVQRIILRSADEFEEIPVDSPHLSEGWWNAESDGQGLWRWTNGNAELPVPQMSGPRMLEIRIASSGVGYRAVHAPVQARAVA